MRPTAVLIALLAGALVGWIARWPGAEPLGGLLLGLEPVGTIFIRLITLVIVPLVVSSLFVAVASLDNLGRLGRIGGATLLYFVLTTLAATLVGVLVALLLHVGSTAAPVLATAGAGGPAPPSGLTDTIVSLVPDNLLAAATRADLLPLLVAVCLFGAAATGLSAEARRPLLALFQTIDRLSAVVLRWIMWLAPAAVFVLLAGAVVRTGTAVLGSLAWFAAVVILALLAHVLLVLMPALIILARASVTRFSRQVSDALVLAFSTASSSAALPVSLAAADRLEVRPEVASLVLPAGTTINKNGAAVYKAVTAICVAHWVGLAVGPGFLIRIVLVSTLAAFTGAGVPGSSLVTTLLVLRTIGLGDAAAAAIALVAGIDRPLDMCRTTVNTLGNLVGAVVVGRTARG